MIAKPTELAPRAGWRAHAGTLLALGLALVVIAAVLGPGLFLGRSPILRDLILYFHPWTEYACRHVAAGEYPLWNPLVYCGTSWAGQTQGRVLYPAFPLYLVLPYPLAAQLDLAIHIAAGVACAFLLARRLGVRTAGALFGALAAVANGWMLAKLEAPLKIAILTLMPVAMLGFAYAREGHARRGAVLLGVAIALQLLNGYPPLSVYVIPAELAAGFALLLGGSRSRTSRRESRDAAERQGDSTGVTSAGGADKRRAANRAAWLQPAVLMTCGAFAGVLVACAALVPFLSDVREAAYSKPMPAAMAAARSFAPVQAIGALLPRWLGLPGADRYWGGELSVYTAGALYIGVPAAAFALIALVAALARASAGHLQDDTHAFADARARRAFVIALAAVALVSILVALGRYGFLFGWLRRAAPAYASTRWPSQSLCVTAATLGLLSSFGVDAVARSIAGAHGKRARRRVLIAGGAIAAILAALSFAPAIDAAALRLLDATILPEQRTPFAMNAEAFLRGDLRRAAFFTAISTAVLALPARAWVLLAALLAVDLALLGRTLVPYTRDDLFAPRAALGALDELRDRQERILRIGNDLPIEVAVYGARDPSILRDARLALVAATPLSYEIPAADGADPMQTARHAYLVGALAREKTPDAIRERIASILGVGAFVPATQPLSQETAATPAIPDTIAYRPATTPPVPFAYLVESVGAIANDDDQIRRLALPQFDPLRMAVVSAPIEGYSLSLSVTVSPAGACRYDRPRPERIRVTVEPRADALLVIRESYHRGWRARVDGRPREIVRANFLFMAVPVRAGEHAVDLEFAPASVRVGFALSLAGAAGLAAIALVKTRRREAPS